MTASDPIPGPASLKQRVFNAAGWSLVGYGLSQAIRFGSSLIMTRLLVPEMFGVMAIAIVITVGLTMLSDLGLRPGIIQSKRGNDPQFLNTAWSVQIVRGVIVWVLMLGVAALFAVAAAFEIVPKTSAYADPSLPTIIAILSAVFIISGFNSTKLHEANRRLDMRRLTFVELAVQTSGLAVTVGWALVDRSIWAMVAGNVSASLMMMVLSHLWLTGTRNRWQWDPSALREILHFGKWIFISSIFAFLVGNGDRLLLAGMVDTSVLGFYSIAFSIVSAVEALLTRLIGGVSFPALSEIVRERPEALRATYYRLHLVIATPIYLCAGLLMVLGEPLIGLLYDPRYAAAGWMLQVLAAGLLAVPFQIAIQCFLALGVPKLNSHILAVRLITLLVAMPLGFQLYSLPGALWGIVLSQLMCVPLIVFFSIRHKIFDLRRELIAMPMVFVGVGAGILALFLIRGH